MQWDRGHLIEESLFSALLPRSTPHLSRRIHFLGGWEGLSGGATSVFPNTHQQEGGAETCLPGTCASRMDLEPGLKLPFAQHPGSGAQWHASALPSPDLSRAAGPGPLLGAAVLEASLPLCPLVAGLPLCTSLTLTVQGPGPLPGGGKVGFLSGHTPLQCWDLSVPFSPCPGFVLQRLGFKMPVGPHLACPVG